MQQKKEKHMQPHSSQENRAPCLPRVSGIPQDLRLPQKTGQELMDDTFLLDEMYDSFEKRKALDDITRRGYNARCPFDTYTWIDPSLSKGTQVHKLSRRT